MKRTFVFGDIHGGLKALKQLLERANITPDDHLIFLGDYVDGWSESAQVIDFLIELNSTHHCVFIKGNHDVWCQVWLSTSETNAIWLAHGGEMTIRSYVESNSEVKARHLNFFANMKDYHVDYENRLFIHAGFSSMHGPSREAYISNYSWDRTLWEMALTMDKRIQKHSKLYPKRLLLFNEIYIGHTPTLNYDVEVPMQGCNVWNIDTGAAFSGRLSCINIDSKEFYQSDKLPELYPNEKGRN